MRYVHVVSVIGLLGLMPLSANAAHPRTCVEEADEHGDFNVFQAQRLCAGAQSTSPALCGNLATHYFTTEQAVYLCVYAQSNSPVQCALSAERSPLTVNQIMYV